MGIKSLLNGDRVLVSYLNKERANAQMIRDILDQNHISETTLANVLGIRKTTLQHYLVGRAIPNTTKMFIVLIYEHPEVIGMIKRIEYIKGGRKHDSGRVLY